MDINFPNASASPWVDPNNITWIHDGDGWIAQSNAAVIIQEAKPPEVNYFAGQEWIRTTDMVKFSLYNDVDGLKWVDNGNGTIGQAAPVVPTGYKNVIINGRLGPNTVNTVYPWIINQRGFNGAWDDFNTAIGDYGFDRWRASAVYQPEQIIEDTSILDGEIYTLSWESPTINGAGSIINTAGPIRSGISPLTGVISGPGVIVEVPRDATNVQLELGSEATSFEIRPIGLELQLCQRYFYSSYPAGTNPGDIAASAVAFLTASFSTKWVPFPMQWPVPMRASPQFKIYSPDTGVVGTVRSINGVADVAVNGFWNLFNTQAMGMVFTADAPQNTRFSFNYTLDAEL